MADINPNQAVAPNGELITQQAAQEQSTGLATTGSSLPAYLAAIDPEDYGTDLMAEYVTPPRISIVQNTSPKELRNMYPEGTIFVKPSNMELVPVNGQPLLFAVVFFFPEFIKWNPRGAKPMMAARSFDPRSEVAMRARSFDKKKIWEKCTVAGFEDKEARNLEMLNFIVVPMSGPPEFVGVPMLLSFSSTGYTDGKNLIEKIKARRCASYGLIFDMVAGDRKNDKGEWMGFNINNSILENGLCNYTPENWIPTLQEFNRDFKAKWQSGLVVASYEQEEEGTDTEQVAANPASPKF